MTSRVIILSASNDYRDQVKSLMVNCRRAGKWDGDFAILCPQDFAGMEFEERGIHVIRTPESTWNNAVKFSVFDPLFLRWDQSLYLDCDTLVQRDLDVAVTETFRPGKILMEGSQALGGGLGTTILEDWEHFAKISGVDDETRAAGCTRLRERFPHVDRPLFASSVMLFSSADVPDCTVEALLAVDTEFRDLNPRGYDQQVMNLVLYDRMAALPKSFATWQPFDMPSNRVASEARGWCGDEFPAIVHCWGARAPWVEKDPSDGDYFNERLGRVCRELYLENLAAFDEEFPVCPIK